MAQEVESFRQSGGSRSGLGLLWPHDPAALTKCKVFSSACSFFFVADPQKGRFISAHSAFQSESPPPKKTQTREGFPSNWSVFLWGTQSGGGGPRRAVIRRSLWRFSIPSVSCEAAWNWPPSWPAWAGPGRASSAQSHSWQWSSWRRKHWRCRGYGALTEMKKKKDQKKKNVRKTHLLCTWCSFSPSKFRCSRTQWCFRQK